MGMNAEAKPPAESRPAASRWTFALATRRRTRIVLGVLAALLIVTAIDGAQWWRQQRWNRLIESGNLGVASQVETKDLPPEVRFARAAAQAASGSDDVALESYRLLQGETPLGQSARVNSGNALLRQAIKIRAGNQPGQAIPLIELAKETYREVLRDDPMQWDARYNLERAQRLLPDPDESDAAAAEAPRNAERAATTMRGVSPGLP